MMIRALCGKETGVAFAAGVTAQHCYVITPFAARLHGERTVGSCERVGAACSSRLNDSQRDERGVICASG